MIKCSGTAARVQTGIPSPGDPFKIKPPFILNVTKFLQAVSFYLRKKRKQKKYAVVSQDPSLLRLAMNRAMNTKPHCAKTVYSGYAVCVKKPSSTFFQGMNINESKKFKRLL